MNKGDYAFLIASPEKALCDLIANSSKVILRYMKDVETYLEQDIRMDMDEFYNMDATIFEDYINVGKKAVARAWEEAQENLAHVLPDDFPLPARYAHPVVLTRMIRILREGRAQSADEALEVLKSDLKALNADVQVSQEEYDEVVAIKSMFLLSDYQ